jgi:hypothetical protein
MGPLRQWVKQKGVKGGGGEDNEPQRLIALLGRLGELGPLRALGKADPGRELVLWELKLV